MFLYALTARQDSSNLESWRRSVNARSKKTAPPANIMVWRGEEEIMDEMEEGNRNF